MPDHDDITPEDMNRLRHALGVQNGISAEQWGYRNFYCSPKTGPEKDSMMRLHEAELVMLYREMPNFTYFEATRAGAERVGLNDEQTERAFKRRG